MFAFAFFLVLVFVFVSCVVLVTLFCAVDMFDEWNDSRRHARIAARLASIK